MFRSNRDADTALSLFELALHGFTFMDIHQARADCLIRIGDILNTQGKVKESKEMWRAARPLFIRSSQMADVSQCDQRLSAELGLSELHTEDA